MRAMYPKRINKSGPAGALAVTGSTLRPIANTTIRATPDTNSGTVDSERLVVLMTRSTTRPRLRAATTPPPSIEAPAPPAEDAGRHDDHEGKGRELERAPERREEEGADR